MASSGSATDETNDGEKSAESGHRGQDLDLPGLQNIASACAESWPEMLLGRAGEKSRLPESGTEPSGSVVPEDLHTIRVDIPRTRGTEPAFMAPGMSARLEGLLVGFCEKEGVRYMQGLHEVAAVFAYLEAETPENVFGGATSLTCFISFVQKFMPCFYDVDGFVLLHVSLLFFGQLLLYHHPDLYNQLEQEGVPPVIYATPWFITLFASRSPLHVVLKLWTQYIRRGEGTFMPFLAVAMMAEQKQAILGAEEDEFNLAVDRARVMSLEQLESVWAAAEALHSRTPKSFTVRMSQVVGRVKERIRQPAQAGKPFAESVLARAEQERRLVMLPREVIAQQVLAEPDRINAASQVPAAGLSKLRLLLLDVRTSEAYEKEHLPHALHFHPSCLRRLVAASAGKNQSQRAERLAAALSMVASSVGERLLHGQPPKASAESLAAPVGEAVASESEALGAEVFQALRTAAAEAWGEGWLSESEDAHLALLGGEADWDEKQLIRAGGAVAQLFAVLTEQLSMPRISVVLGGAAALHREAQKRGVHLHQGQASAKSGRLGSLAGAARAFAGGLRQKAQQASLAFHPQERQEPKEST